MEWDELGKERKKLKVSLIILELDIRILYAGRNSNIIMFKLFITSARVPEK